jgi:hypothetical protein
VVVEAYVKGVSTWTGRYFSLGSMTKVDALEGGEDPKELLAQIA